MHQDARRRVRLPILLAALLAVTAFAPPLAATDEASGLTAGTSVPRFMLPVVNQDAFKEAKKWGPNKWVGQGADTTKKLMIMSFFATYCEPCKKEMPELVRLYNSYGKDGLGVMLVSIDKGRDKREELATLSAANDVSFPVVHDAFQVVARRYKAERLPYMLMVGPDGVIKTVHVGYTEEMKNELENEVRGHLGLPPVAKQTPTPVAAATPTGKGTVSTGGEIAVADEKKPEVKKPTKKRGEAKPKKRKKDEG